MPVKKRFSHQDFGKSRERRDFYIALPKKNIYSALCHTLHHHGSLWITFALHCVHIVYIIIIFPYCISSATIFSISIIFSLSFYGFLSTILFSISIYCGFTSFYHYAALVVPFCNMAVFFPLFFRTFDVETSFWCR